MYVIIIYASLAKWLSVRLQTKWLWVWIPLPIKDFFIFMTMPSFKQVESNCGKKVSCERGCSCIIKFSYCLNFGYCKYGIINFFQCEPKIAVHTARMKKKNCEFSNFWCFFNKSNSILRFFQEELASLLSAGNPFSINLES